MITETFNATSQEYLNVAKPKFDNNFHSGSEFKTH